MTNFKTFKAGELFDVKSNPQLDKQNFHFNKDGKYPYFTRTVLNNGIAGYVDYLDDEHLTRGGVLAVGMLGMKFFYFDKDFYSGQFTKHIRPYNFNLTRNRSLYFKAIFDKSATAYQGVLVRDFTTMFNNTDVVLPITNSGEIDFNYIEQYIQKLEKEHIEDFVKTHNQKLEAYLKVANIPDYKPLTLL